MQSQEKNERNDEKRTKKWIDLQERGGLEWYVYRMYKINSLNISVTTRDLLIPLYIYSYECITVIIILSIYQGESKIVRSFFNRIAEKKKIVIILQNKRTLLLSI